MSPTCGPCAGMIPKVRAWQDALQDRLTIVVVSAGTPEQNVHFMDAGVEDVLLQEQFEVGEAFAINATPTGLVVSRDGFIASNLGETEQAIEPLVRLALRQGTNLLSVEGSAA
jgi:thiol-disulfide isomerase/thioredoxin